MALRAPSMSPASMSCEISPARQAELQIRFSWYHQVPVAVVILREKDEVVVALVLRILQAVVVVPRDIHLAADDGLHYEVAVRILVALVVGILEKLLDPVHVAVVGDGQGGHAEFPGALEELPDVGESVKDGILGMDVEVYE